MAGLFPMWSPSTTRRSGSPKGSGRRRMPSSREQIAVVAPMPSANARMTVTLNPGLLRNWRAACRMSRRKVAMAKDLGLRWSHLLTSIDDAGRRSDETLFAPELVSPLEFLTQSRRAQVLVNIREAPLQSLQHRLDGRGVGMRNVTPHRKWAGAQPRHFAQCAASHMLQLRRVSYLLLEQRTQGRSRELRQMADPGHQFVVARRVEIDRLGANGDDQIAPGRRQFRSAR